MKAWLYSFIQTPAFDDDDRRAAQLLRLVLAVLFSGYPGRDVAELGDGPRLEYLAKPVTPKQLLDRLDQLFGST